MPSTRKRPRAPANTAADEPPTSSMVVDVQALSTTLADAVSKAVKTAMKTNSTPPSRTAKRRRTADLVDSEVTQHVEDIQGNSGTPGDEPSTKYQSVAVPLGNRLSDKIKNKIWANEFVDFSQLMQPSQQEKFSLSITNYNTSSSSQPKLAIEPTRSAKKLTHINQWLTAFHTFCAIYTVRHEKEAPGLMKYAETVRDLAAKPGDWLFYDEQFRYLRQSDPDMYPWDGIHWELWLKAATSSSLRSGKQTQFTLGKFGSRTRPAETFPRGTCWLFQGGKHCKGCQYQHICFKCGDKHPASQCSSATQGTTITRAPPSASSNASKGKAT